MSTVHVVVPDVVDDPARPSGGNTYDRRVCHGLSQIGWSVQRHAVTGDWPGAEDPAWAALGATLAGIPDGAVVLLDGLVASAVPELLVPEASRLRLVVLVHMPLGQTATATGADERAREYAVLSAVAGVVATSGWSRRWLLATYRLSPGRVVAVPPGVEPAAVVTGSATGRRLLCVGAITPTKGHDVLVEALALVPDLGWSCTCVGSTAVDPAFTARVRARSVDTGLGGRLAFTGPLTDRDLAAVYSRADLLVTPSRAETFGMVVSEALARGVPVVGAQVGGLPEALGRTLDGRRPGILVPPSEPAALAFALRRWLTDAGLRDDLRRAARERRGCLTDWSLAAARLSAFLAEVAA